MIGPATEHDRERLRAALYDERRISPTLLLLKTGTETHPIFLAPGLGDDVGGLLDLAYAIATERAVYGLQPKGASGVEAPLSSLAEMADMHLADIRNIQPKGPYYLIGYSFGGLVMLEIARHLVRQQEKVALLVMLDSYPARRCLPLSQRIPLLSRLACRKLANILRNANPVPHPGAPPTNAIEQARAHVNTAQETAWQAHRPGSYEGLIRYIDTAEKVPYFAHNPRAVWAHWAARLTLETVPGNHVQMLIDHVPEVSAILSRYLAETENG
jgi:acetoacetyl-CoA synthetase